MKHTKTHKPSTKERVLKALQNDLNALKNGTLQTRPAADFLKELKAEGYL